MKSLPNVRKTSNKLQKQELKFQIQTKIFSLLSMLYLWKVKPQDLEMTSKQIGNT
jgi:hypothetical protein